MTTFQEQMAGPSRSRFNGWLTMAPEVDVAPIATVIPVAAPSDTTQAVASTHGFGMLGQTVRLPQRKKQRAIFQVGSPGLSDDADADCGSSHSSHCSSDAPDFDVRASFAPMPTYGKAKTSSMPLESSAQSEHAGEQQHDTGGLSFAGRQWKGKTVHAVEQELEALRDVKLMSHAPDATYLASRLEGLRRNLEIEERRPSYVEYEEDSFVDDEEPRILAHPDPSLEPYQQSHSAADIALRMGVRALPALAHRPVSNASSISLVEGDTPEDFDCDIQFSPSVVEHINAQIGPGHATIHDPEQLRMPASASFVDTGKMIDPAARAAALNSRIDIRNLRRSDLDQVRDLHAFHGEFDQAPGQAETYASTASFLLRLLVDDRHVCLVAVAKPIPEPVEPLPAAADLASFPTNGSGSANSLVASPASTVGSPETDARANEAEDSSVLLHLSPPADDSALSSRAFPASDLNTAETTPSSSLFLSSKTGALLLPRRKKLIAPRGQHGRINNTPATSVFSDILAERGAPPKRLTLDDLPGPTEDMAHVRVKRAMNPLSTSGQQAGSAGLTAANSGSLASLETETIVGVVSARVSVVVAPSEDSLFASVSSASKEGGDEPPSSLIDIHLLTLAIAPEERGQGLGAKLLSMLHGECMTKSRLMALRITRPRKGPSWGSIPTVAPLTPRFIDLPDEKFGTSGYADDSSQTADLLSSVETLPSRSVVDEEAMAMQPAAPSSPSGKHLTRTFLEIHPSNLHAIALYTAHGFHRPSDPGRAVKKGFYRGDTRIATRERAKPGGTDAWVLERFDGLLPTAASSSN